MLEWIGEQELQVVLGVVQICFLIAQFWYGTKLAQVKIHLAYVREGYKTSIAESEEKVNVVVKDLQVRAKNARTKRFEYDRDFFNSVDSLDKRVAVMEERTDTLKEQMRDKHK